MFTGIVETTAEILEKTEAGFTLTRPKFFTDVKAGHSIAVAGTCLSVVRLTKESMGFDIIPETWARTSLGDRNVGDALNVERSVPVSGRFEGHMVQGHVEGTGEVLSLQKDGRWITLIFEAPEELLPFIVYKGAIAVEGVSLTVAGVDWNKISIALIPHTLEVTTLGKVKPGDRLNIETDVVGRYVYAMVQKAYSPM